MAGLALTTTAELQFSRRSWLLTTPISKYNTLGNHICMHRNKVHSYVWISSGEKAPWFCTSSYKESE
ncbi:hypothetical protein KI387_027873, partial [Taxus chinensis]